MSQSFDASRSLTAFEQDSTLVAVIEMSQSKWLVAAMIPGVARQPLKKLDANADALLKLLQRWQDEARKAGRTVRTIVLGDWEIRVPGALGAAQGTRASANTSGPDFT